METTPIIFESRRRFISLFSAVLILGVAWTMLSAGGEGSTTSGRIPSPRQGFLAPDFTLKSLDGKQITLSDFRGDPVVLNLWASWCPPCRAEMPEIQQVYDQYHGRGLQVLAVNMTYQDGIASAESFVNEYGLTFPIPLDTNGVVGEKYQMRALPSTFFIDGEGVIQDVIIGGPMSEATLQSSVEALFQGSP
ncbi:MAG: TlpA disulfide reductase family protein [Anaerolineales bacterium]|jgi:peroxiredoxin